MAKSDDPYFRLRVPEPLKRRIEEAASDNHRSMTAEIIARLEESFDPVVLNVRSTGDMYGELEKIVQRVIKTVREEERSHQGSEPFDLGESIIRQSEQVSQPDFVFHNPDGSMVAIELKSPQNLDKRSAQTLIDQLRNLEGVHFDNDERDPRKNVALLDQVAIEWIKKRSAIKRTP